MTSAVAEPKGIGLSRAAHANRRANRRLEEMTSADWARLVELGTLLRDTRVAAGLTLDDLGPIVGAPGSLRCIEVGSVRTRPSRLRPWLEFLGIDPEPVLEQYRDVIAADRADGKDRWRPVVSPQPPRRPALVPLAPQEKAALGAELWQIRVLAGLTRPQLAREIQASRITVWLVEHGLRGPSPDLADRWLEAAGGAPHRTVLAIRFPGRIRPVVGMASPDQSRHAPTGRFVATNGDLTP